MLETVFWALLVAFLAFGALANIAMIGKPRGPITPGQAVFTVLVTAGIVAGVINYGILGS